METKNLEGKTKKELRQIAKEEGAYTSASTKKQDIIDLIVCSRRQWEMIEKS